MARKNDLSGKLGGDSPQGWRDQIGNQAAPSAPVEQEPSKPRTKTDTYIRKTYLMNQELIDRIKAVVERENVGQNELVRYLIGMALTQIEEGIHELPTQPGRNTLGV